MRLCPGSLSRNFLTSGLLLGLACGLSATANAQQGQPAPQGVPSVPAHLAAPRGIVPEPSWFERTAVFADRNLGGGGSSNGFYVNSQSPVPGAGFLTIGPGYRRWYNNDSLLIDGSGGVSVRGYKTAQARVELPSLFRSRVALGTQYLFQDFRSVKSFGEGPATLETDLSTYHLRSQNLIGYATVRPLRSVAVDTHLGYLAPSLRTTPGAEPAYVHGGVAFTADTRDFPSHPTRGGFVRVSASRYTDRDGGNSSFDRYESEVAGFVPLASSRIVVAVRGWLVASDTESGQTVPFYLQPNLGGSRSLRSYSDYRFHDRHMLLANAELRVALFTHLDVVAFTDAGNVAARLDDLDLDKRSYGGGLRFHSRRETFLRLDVATGREGWRTTFSLSESLGLTRNSRRAAPAPFVP